MLRLLRRVEASVTWTWLCLEPDVTTRCENLYGASGLLPLCYTCPMVTRAQGTYHAISCRERDLEFGQLRVPIPSLSPALA